MSEHGVRGLKKPVQERLDEAKISMHVDTLLFWSRVYEDNDTKDVKIETNDGTVLAHSLLLQNLSEPFKAMITNGMSESKSKSIHMSDFTSEQLNFFLRLAYTGTFQQCALSDNIPVCSPACDPSKKILVEAIAEGDNGQSVSRFNMQARTLFEKMINAWCQHNDIKTTEAMFLHGSRQIQPNDSPMSIGFQGSTLRIEVVPREYGDERRSVDHVKLDLLLSCASLANKYLVHNLHKRMLDCIKLRLTSSNFDSIMGFALADNCNGLQHFCLRFAELEPQIKIFWKEGKFSSLVTHALDQLWPSQQSAFKRLRVSGAQVFEV